jgi:hypothetical protein
MTQRTKNASANHRPDTQSPLKNEVYKMLSAVTVMRGEVILLKEATKEPLTNILAQFLSAQYVVALRSAVRKAGGKPLDLKTLQALCGDVAALRRGDQNADRLCVERERLILEYERLGLAKKDSHERWKKKFTMAMEAFQAHVQNNPKAKAAYYAFADQLGEVFEKSPETPEHIEPVPPPRRDEGTAIRPSPTKSD